MSWRCAIVEALARDFVPGGRQVDLHETERPALFRFGKAHAHL
jgi:hypothetical protein